ncbi:MAG TPA: NADH-quinone oxidoreductase subunit M [Chryseosolibacter sp.]
MILLALIIILMLGGIIAWLVSRANAALGKSLALLTVVIDFIISVFLWMNQGSYASSDQWLIKFNAAWIPTFGISLSFAMDGLSLLMVMLTFFLGIIAVLTSWKEIQYRTGFYYFNLLWVLAGITGVFLTMDLFLFYFFWEVMLIPMYFLIGIWGHENKTYAAYKFFIFTQASGLLMLLAILSLYFIHGSASGTYTFNYFELLNTALSPEAGRLLMLGFLAAFIVKLPVVPFHTWLPDAHSQAPTAGSLILAGLLLKTGAYGLMRFVVPFFPEASVEIAPVAMLFGVIGILYGAVLAYSQTDFKRLVAYTSVSHMGFIMLGVFSFNELAWQGVVMQMITHGISTGALFILAGALYERIHTRDVSRMGGFWTKMPSMGVIALIFSMASLGLPGLGNFVAEFATLIGSWSANKPLTIFAAIGLVGATAYSLRIMQKIFYGEARMDAHRTSHSEDLNLREKFIFIPMVVLIIWLGVYPQPFIETSKGPVTNGLKMSEKKLTKPFQPVTREYLSKKGVHHE